MPRVKKLYHVITFHTTTHAMAYEKKCMEENIPGRIIPVPREITAGCGLAWRILSTDYTQYQEKITALQMPFEADVELLL